MADSTNTLSGTQGLLAQWRHDYEAMKAQRDELLAALKALSYRHEWTQSGPCVCEAHLAACAAIAHAEG